MRATFCTLLVLTLCSAPGRAARQAGPVTVRDDGANAFGHPLPALDAEERRAFAVGNAFFKENWVTPPASTAGRDGLGPLFNARSCSSCHLRDGRGCPPLGEEGSSAGLLFRAGVAGPGGDRPHPVYGGQLQDAAVLGVAPEAHVRTELTAVPGEYADGEAYELARPRYVLERAAYGDPGPELRLGPRVASQLVGLGLLEAIPEQALLAQEDPEDADGDGISGRAHRVRSARSGEPALGRFGWKATQPTVEEQVAAAFVNDIGITSSLFPREVVTPEQARRFEPVSGGAPELSDHKLQRVTLYCQVLAVPAQRDALDPRVILGAQLFDELGCARCHTPQWTTGEQEEIPTLAGQEIRPYTDLLLHDMGAELADEKQDGEARPAEWRTPPLWGIGLVETVNGHTRFLHDGRARDLAEAILWHGGEAEAAREAFRALPAEERGALLSFLRSL